MGDADVAVVVEHAGLDVGDGHDAAGGADVAGVLGVDVGAADGLGLEELLDEVFHVSGEHTLEDALVGGAAHGGGDFGEGGRLFEEVAVEDAAGALPEGEPFGYAVGVGGRDAADLVCGALVVVPAEQVVAVGEGLEAGGFEVVDVEAVVAEFEVVDDLVLEHVADVGAAGYAEVGE